MACSNKRSSRRVCVSFAARARPREHRVGRLLAWLERRVFEHDHFCAVGRLARHATDSGVQSAALVSVDAATLRLARGVVPACCYAVGKLGARPLLSTLRVADHPDTGQRLHGAGRPGGGPTARRVAPPRVRGSIASGRCDDALRVRRSAGASGR